MALSVAGSVACAATDNAITTKRSIDSLIPLNCELSLAVSESLRIDCNILFFIFNLKNFPGIIPEQYQNLSLFQVESIKHGLSFFRSNQQKMRRCETTPPHHVSHTEILSGSTAQKSPDIRSATESCKDLQAYTRRHQSNSRKS